MRHRQISTDSGLCQPLNITAKLVKLYWGWLMRHWRLAAAALALAWAAPAWAHHPFGGETPTTAWAGFLSGLGHPVIGIDHLVAILAVGLVAAVRSIWLPLAFVAAASLATALHVAGMDLPGVEVAIASSVIGLGLLLVRAAPAPTLALLVVGALTGFFHGYAYAEAIIGAEMTPLLAYGAGLATVQLAIAIGAMLLAQRFWQHLNYRFAGFSVIGAGVVFLSAIWL